MAGERVWVLCAARSDYSTACTLHVLVFECLNALNVNIMHSYMYVHCIVCVLSQWVTTGICSFMKHSAEITVNYTYLP